MIHRLTALSRSLNPIWLHASRETRTNCLRPLSTGTVHLKALENWKRPTIEEYGTPTEKWEDVYNRNQKKGNLILLAGLAFFGVTLVAAKLSNVFFFYWTPSFAYDTGYVTKVEPSSKLPLKNPINPVPPKPAPVKSAPPAVPSSVPITSAHKDATPGLPEHVPYLMIGAGTAAFAASRAIRAKDPEAKILMIGEESRLPYMRPPLSKELWFGELGKPEFDGDVRFTQWNGKTRSLFFEPKAFYMSPLELGSNPRGGISVITGRKVVKVRKIGFY